MSIKKLFESTDKSNNYLSDTTEQQTFNEVESARNARAIKLKQETYVPQIDYSKPENFAHYGSAYLYYKSSIERVIDYFPYDGSDAEVNEYHNKSLDIDRYIFDNLYPRTTGYATLCVEGWGARDGSIVRGFGKPITQEYIEFFGGPHTITASTSAKLFQNPSSSNISSANIYDTNIYTTARLPTNYGSGSRESNLKSNFDTGVTVEFWLKTGSLDSALTEKQVVFDMWNNQLSSSAPYGRITIALTSSATSPFLITAQSGTTGIFEQSIGNTVTTGSLADWKFYSLALYNSGSDFIAKLYVDGQLDDTNTYSSITLNELQSKKMQARIGGLLTAPSGTAGAPSNLAGAGKLSGSMDEFRFWKVRRNSHEIAKNWFVPVNGGTNTDISNTTLGVYYKFNEGITQTSSIDRVVLDYSGRITNGTWTGYTATSRNTGSAIVSASAANVEYPDPIIRSSHPDIATLKTGLLNSGSYHDNTNVASLLSMIPSWIVEDHEATEHGNLQIICHIVGTYFDSLYTLISQVPKFRSQTYTSSSYIPLPFAQHMPQSLGLYTPEIFIDSDVLERFKNRDQTMLFESDLNNMKNMIYLNLYNNLANIFKAKGTSKAIRNVLSCFNLNEEILRLNAYYNDQKYELKDNLIQTIVDKKSANFNYKNNLTGTVYQAQNASNADSLGYISGSQGSGYENKYGFTVESDIFFPAFKQEDAPFDREFLPVSLFGMHTVDTGSADSLSGVNTTWVDLDYANFQVLAVRDSPWSKNVYFKLTSSNSPSYFPELTSSTFLGTYDNDRWNLSVRIKPSNYPVTEIVSGSTDYTYDLFFRGVNTYLGTVQDSFSLTGSITKARGNQILGSAKRLYAGAHKTNLTGATLKKSDVEVSSLKYWTKYINDRDLDQHLFDITNQGISGSYMEISPKDPNDGNLEILNLNTLALSWDFSNVTSSNAAGSFNVTDMSSGSAFMRDNYGWLGNITGYQLTGLGKGFQTSSVEAIESKLSNTYKFIDPQIAVSSDMVQVLDDDDKVFGVDQTVPNFFFALEKSMYNAISEEMLKFFAGVVDFNNVIGEPVNRYRERYKALEKLREIFFRKVTDIKDVEKYLNYYKWFDESLTSIISQLIPGSAQFADGVLNIVESHVLERNKYQTKFPTLEFKPSDPAAAFSGIAEKLYPFPKGSSPLPSSPRRTNISGTYWHLRAERSAPSITSGNPSVDTQRDKIRDTVAASPNLSQSLPVLSTVGGVKYKGRGFAGRAFAKTYKLDMGKPNASVYKGGTNFKENKNIQFTYTALRPAGPVNTTDGRFIPLNVLTAFEDSLEGLRETYRETLKEYPTTKIKRVFKVNHGRKWQNGFGYNSLKSTFAFPFNVISSSVTTGYNKRVVERVSSSLEITNLHHDSYGAEMEIPMQGPFTNYAVGGHQSRHIAINKGPTLDTYLTRPEAWKILLGQCNDVTLSGAIGMVGPDYPWPEANDVGARPYPMTASEKAVYYRDFVAKRPVNIRNIHHTTGSTILGNYNQQYEVVNTVGAYSNPRRFLDQLPTIDLSVPLSQATATIEILTLVPGNLNGEYIQLTDETHPTVTFTCDTSITTAVRDSPTEYRFGSASSGVADIPRQIAIELDEALDLAYNNGDINIYSLRNGDTLTLTQMTGSGVRGNTAIVTDIDGGDATIAAAFTGGTTGSFLPKKANVINTFINWHRGAEGHFDFGLTYAPTQFTGSGHQTVIVGRFANCGGWEVMSRGFEDIRSSEFSPYVSINNRNLTVIKPSQGPSGTLSEPVGEGIPGIRVTDIHAKDYGLRSQLSRHTARFGRDSLWITGTTAVTDGPEQTAGGPGASFTQYPGFHKVHRNTKRTLKYTSQSVNPNIFNPPTVAFVSAAQYDNFYVTHPIPRSDKQYSWFTGSLGTASLVDLRYARFAPIQTTTEGFYSTSAGYVPYFEFITASNVGMIGDGLIEPHEDAASPVDITYVSPYLRQVPTLNIRCIDPVSGSPHNVIGFPATSPFNTYTSESAFPISSTPLGGTVNYFNLLMFKRGNFLGWNWRKNRQSNNPILLKERKDNVITAISGADNTLVQYRLTPLSMKGRPTLVNFLADGVNNATIKAGNTNLEIFFDENRLDNLCFPNQGDIVTPFEDVWSTLETNSYNVNWVLYREALFPSLYNEFYTSSLQRIEYDNLYWRNLRGTIDSDTGNYPAQPQSRNSIGSAISNSFGVNKISQSCWLLDAQTDFLTRTKPSLASNKAFTNGKALKATGSCGELQNDYSFAFVTRPHRVAISDTGVLINGAQAKKVRNLTVAGLYSRKHMSLLPHSVVAPSGISIPIGTITPKSLSDIYTVYYFSSSAHWLRDDIYAGEAYWDAPANAGIIKQNGSASVFESRPSKPWFTDYSNYSHDLKLIAKDFSIVPEFRVSEHVDDYLTYGLFNEGKTDTFEIVGTAYNSSQSTFYKDYSNSDFMRGFLNIKDLTSLKATEIKLVCSAAIRLNPYKGFYPAQRTLDLVSQFSKSFGSGFLVTGSGVFTTVRPSPASAGSRLDTRYTPTPSELISNQGGALRSILQPLFAPGILYNSIKSGLAVDWPLVTATSSIFRNVYGTSPGAGENQYHEHWALTTNPSHSYAAAGTSWDGSSSYFNVRLPFETIINPGTTLKNIDLFDVEPHPSAALDITGSLSIGDADKTYSKMANNFFGEVGNFFLKDRTFSKLQSGIISDTLTFKSGAVYGARLKIRRSMSGSRVYTYESGSFEIGTNAGYSKYGGARMTGALGSALKYFFPGEGFPLPQDPRQNDALRESFTMYSRPSAFGPQLAGRPSGSYATASAVLNQVPVDCFNGFNWAYTPPYYHGESWVDFIFRPVDNREYTLDKILAEMDTVFWRVDPGAPYRPGSGANKQRRHTLLPDWASTRFNQYNVDGSGLPDPSAGHTDIRLRTPYQASTVNGSAMQLSASVNLFGVESVSLQEMNKFGNQNMSRNQTVGKRWVIQPKFETPMLNFNDTGFKPLVSGSGVTLPTGYGSGSVPRGMWHQFGIIEPDPNKGVFLEIDDIPSDWLKNHYDVILSGSVYNENSAFKGQRLYKKMKSLTDLFGFRENTDKARLGELAEFRTLKEAIVAVPYILEVGDMDSTERSRMSNTLAATKKKFIEISQERFSAARAATRGSLAGDSLDAAGESIRLLLQKMDRYVLPPQFDFLSNDSVDPIVMYMFEFEYQLDKDDLSYIWQNLAPRNYKKMEFQVQSTAHDLMNTELLYEDNLMDNENLRWMVFKVHQKSQIDYFDQVAPQANTAGGNATFDLPGPLHNRISQNRADGNDDYNISFNWPYDYVSFVELVKFEAQVLYEKPEGSAVDAPQTTPVGDLSTTGARNRRLTEES